jgi:hypothetical protein
MELAALASRADESVTAHIRYDHFCTQLRGKEGFLLGSKSSWNEKHNVGITSMQCPKIFIYNRTAYRRIDEPLSFDPRHTEHKRIFEVEHGDQTLNQPFRTDNVIVFRSLRRHRCWLLRCLPIPMIRVRPLDFF